MIRPKLLKQTCNVCGLSKQFATISHWREVSIPPNFDMGRQILCSQSNIQCQKLNVDAGI